MLLLEIMVLIFSADAQDAPKKGLISDIGWEFLALERQIQDHESPAGTASSALRLLRTRLCQLSKLLSFARNLLALLLGGEDLCGSIWSLNLKMPVCKYMVFGP